MNQGPMIRLQKDAFSFLLLFFPGSEKKKKVEKQEGEKQELKKVEEKEKQKSGGRYEMHFQL